MVHGVQVESAIVRTTWTPWAASARLCLGRWQTGWELSAHAREEQDRERVDAGADWEDKGYVFTSPTGEPLSPNTDYHVWKRLLRDAGVRDRAPL